MDPSCSLIPGCLPSLFFLSLPLFLPPSLLSFNLFFFPITTLLRYNSHTAQFTSLRWTVSGLPLASVSLASSGTCRPICVCHCAGCCWCHRPCLWIPWFSGGSRWEVEDVFWWSHPEMPWGQERPPRAWNAFLFLLAPHPSLWVLLTHLKLPFRGRKWWWGGR